jgi:hypothetical protein
MPGSPEDANERESSDDVDPDHQEKVLLSDEGAMARLYYQHGFEAVERVLLWLPVSTHWYRNPETRLTSLTKLCMASLWETVSGQCEKYYARASENGMETDCDDYLERVFTAAGGGDAQELCYERLNPVDSVEAAEEEEMYRLDYLD